MSLDQYIKTDEFQTLRDAVARCLADREATLATLKEVLGDKRLQRYLPDIRIGDVVGGASKGTTVRAARKQGAGAPRAEMETDENKVWKAVETVLVAGPADTKAIVASLKEHHAYLRPDGRRLRTFLGAFETEGYLKKLSGGRYKLTSS